MKEVGFHVDDVELVTDRGYKSANSIQVQRDARVKFVQGLRIDEDSIKAKFDKYMVELRGNGNYLPEWGYSTLTLAKEESELWQQKTKTGNVQVHVKTHLYFSNELALNGILRA